MTLNTEYRIRLYDDRGDYIAMNPNVDGFPGLIEIVSVVSGSQEGRIVLEIENIDTFVEALKRFKELNGPKTKLEWFMGPPVSQPGASPILPVHIQPLVHHNK